MEGNSLTRKEILDYLVKRTDRELSRAQRNGMTIWALLGSIGIVVFQLANLLPNVIKEEQINDVAILFTGWLNLIISIWNIFSVFNESDRNLLLDYRGVSKLKCKLLIQSFSILFLIYLNTYSCSLNNAPCPAVNVFYIFIYSINLIYVFCYCRVFIKTFNLFKQSKLGILMLKPTAIWCFAENRNYRETFSWTILGTGILGSPFITNAKYFMEHNVMDMVKVAMLFICLGWLLITVILQYADRLSEDYISTRESFLMTSSYPIEMLIFEIKKIFGHADISDFERYVRYGVLCFEYSLIEDKYMKFSIIGKNSMKNKGFKIATDLVEDLGSYVDVIKEIEKIKKYLDQFVQIRITDKKILESLDALIEKRKKDANWMLEEIKVYLKEVESDIK